MPIYGDLQASPRSGGQVGRAQIYVHDGMPAQVRYPVGKVYIEELNARFMLAGVGYQFVEGKLIRIDSTVAHEEA